MKLGRVKSDGKRSCECERGRGANEESWVIGMEKRKRGVRDVFHSTYK